MRWAIETEVMGEDIQDLVQEVKAQGHEAIVMSAVPFCDTHFLDHFADTSIPTLFYGSIEMGYRINREAKTLPAIYSDLPKYDCTNYYPELGPWLLNSEYAMVPYGELHRRKDWLYDKLSIQGTVFIRPNRGNKVFTGKAVNYEDFERDIRLMGFYDVEPNELCVVAEPRNVATEWRFVVVDHQIITGSRYTDRYNKGERFPLRPDNKADQSAISLGQRVLNETGWAPERAWTLDICQTVMGNFYVLEIGCFSCAGLYKCDPEVIVREVSRVALEDWKEVYG